MRMSVSLPRNHRWLSAESSLSIRGTSVGHPRNVPLKVCAERSKQISFRDVVSVASELRNPTPPSVGGCYPGYGQVSEL